MSNSRAYCKDDITKIENYQRMLEGKARGERWDLHHRLELTINGEFAHTAQELIDMNMYFDRPFYELIFLSRSEHIKLHQMAHNSFAGRTHNVKQYRIDKSNGCTLNWNDWQKYNKINK